MNIRFLQVRNENRNNGVRYRIWRCEHCCTYFLVKSTMVLDTKIFSVDVAPDDLDTFSIIKCPICMMTRFPVIEEKVEILEAF